jgi:hypothetical protein
MRCPSIVALMSDAIRTICRTRADWAGRGIYIIPPASTTGTSRTACAFWPTVAGRWRTHRRLARGASSQDVTYFDAGRALEDEG